MTYPTQEELEAMAEYSAQEAAAGAASMEDHVQIFRETYAHRIIEWHNEQLRKQEPVAWWIPEAEQFAIMERGKRPFAKAWKPLHAAPVPAPAVPEVEARGLVREAIATLRSYGNHVSLCADLEAMLAAATTPPVVKESLTTAPSDDAKDAALKLAWDDFDRIRSLAAAIGNDRIFDTATESMKAIDAAMKGGAE